MLFVSYMGEACTRKLVGLLSYIFSLFGVQLNDTKCSFVPSLVVTLLGYVVHSSGRLQLTGKGLSKCPSRLSSLLATSACHKRFVSFKKLRSFAGVAASTYAATALTCL